MLAAQPAEKSAFEQLGVETVGLRSPVIARHRDTRGVNDVGLNAARLEPACQPAMDEVRSYVRLDRRSSNSEAAP